MLSRRMADLATGVLLTFQHENIGCEAGEFVIGRTERGDLSPDHKRIWLRPLILF